MVKPCYVRAWSVRKLLVKQQSHETGKSTVRVMITGSDLHKHTTVKHGSLSSTARNDTGRNAVTKSIEL